MTDSELIKNHTVFFAYFCHLMEQGQDSLLQELCDIGMKLEEEISRRKITNTEIDEFMKNVSLSPQDQMMVATYIYPESDLFNVIIGQS
tara:strand:- start:103 stop:369 length:267 start_codon:yes stop_codon:yes gene_type:complete